MLKIIIIWLAVGWIGTAIIWFDARIGMFRPGWRLTVLCALILLTGPFAVVLALLGKFATALDHKKPWATWLVQKRTR